MILHKLIPNKLKSGNTVRIISPSATCVEQTDAKEQRQQAEKFLTGLGLKVEYGQHALKKNYYKAGTLAERLADFHAAFADPQVSAVIAMQGGDNSNELLPHIDWNIVRNNPKYFLGSSDITVLLNAIFAQTGIVTYHGIDILWGLGKNGTSYTKKLLVQNLFEDRWEFLKNSEYPDWRPVRSGTAEGICLGGCLPSFGLLYGTPYNPMTVVNQPFIFIMESISQPISILESYISQLTQQPEFQKNCQGIIVGYFFLCREEKEEDNHNVAEIVLEYTQDNPIPIIEIQELGHAVENLLFPIGGTMRVEVGNKSTIRYK